MRQGNSAQRVPSAIATRSGLASTRPTAAAAAPREPLAVSIRSTGSPMNNTVVTAMIAVIGPAAAPPIWAAITGMPRKTLFEKQAPMPVMARSSTGARRPNASTAASRTRVGPK